MTVEAFNELLEDELSRAVEVKDSRSLHRAVVLMGENLVRRDQHESRFDRMLGELAQMRQEFREETRALRADFDKHLAITERRFEAMDRRFDDLMAASQRHSEDVNRRFEDVNKRFDDVNRRFDDSSKRFNTVQWLIGTGFVVLAALMSLYQAL